MSDLNKYPWLNSIIKNLKDSKLPSSFIIEGSKGLAKSELAKYFAKKILCNSNDSPCLICNSCNYFEAESHPDFAFLSSNNRSSQLVPITKNIYSRLGKSISDDQINSKTISGMRGLISFLELSNTSSSNRVAIIFNSELMNKYAQNSLLKTLEDLPNNKFIILVSDKKNYFLPTIYSRVKRISVINPNINEIDEWLKNLGYIDFSALNFEPDAAPLEIEKLIINDKADQYRIISQNINMYCLNQISSPDLLNIFKELNISFEDKINSLILYLKTCLAISINFYKPYPYITSIKMIKFDERSVSDLIEELIDYKAALSKVPSLNEQIGLNYFFSKLKKIF